MSNQVLEMLTNDELVISDRELDSEIVDKICEMISGYLIENKETDSYRKSIYEIDLI